jgi:hypothetical protein
MAGVEDKRPRSNDNDPSSIDTTPGELKSATPSGAQRVAAVLAVQPDVNGWELPEDFDIAAAGAVADEHYGAIFDAIAAANSGEGSRDAVLATLIEAVLPPRWPDGRRATS